MSGKGAGLGDGTVTKDEIGEYGAGRMAGNSGNLQHQAVDRDGLFRKFGFPAH
jgi:hypothetical protein